MILSLLLRMPRRGHECAAGRAHVLRRPKAEEYTESTSGAQSSLNAKGYETTEKRACSLMLTFFVCSRKAAAARGDGESRGDACVCVQLSERHGRCR